MSFAFEGCKNLKNVNIMNESIIIENDSFKDCHINININKIYNTNKGGRQKSTKKKSTKKKSTKKKSTKKKSTKKKSTKKIKKYNLKK